MKIHKLGHFVALTWICIHDILCVIGTLQQPAVPGEYIIQLGDFSEEDIPTLVPHATVVRVYSIGSEKFALIRTERMKHLADEDSNSVEITTSANVTLHPNRIFQGQSEQTGADRDDDCTCSKQETGIKYWGLTRISSRHRPDFDPEDSYVYNDTGRNVTVFVMDSGVNVNHVTFGGRAVAGYTTHDLLDSEGERDWTGHGTAVASIIAGTFHGVAKQASIVSVKILNKNNDGTDDRLFEGLEWISNQTMNTSSEERFVINLSLAASQENASCSKDPLCIALDKLQAVVVAAAGNQYSHGPHRKSCHLVPASFSNVISVAATNMRDRLWEGTVYGRCVDMLAPGHDILSACHTDNTSEDKVTGSSFAAPFVAGVVARHLQNYNHQPCTGDMLQLLRDTAIKNQTNAHQYNTSDYLVYNGCPEECRLPVVHGSVTLVVIICVVIGLFIAVCCLVFMMRQRLQVTRDNNRPNAGTRLDYMELGDIRNP